MAFCARRTAQKLPFFFSLCFWFFASPNGGTSRQLCPRALSPSSSQRSTACTLTFSAPRKSPRVGEHDATPARTDHEHTKICSKILSQSPAANPFFFLLARCLQSHFWHAHRPADHARLLHPTRPVTVSSPIPHGGRHPLHCCNCKDHCCRHFPFMGDKARKDGR